MDLLLHDSSHLVYILSLRVRLLNVGVAHRSEACDAKPLAFGVEDTLLRVLHMSAMSQTCNHHEMM